MAADTGCTIHLGDATTPLQNETATPNGIQVTTAGNSTISGTAKGNLTIPGLNTQATECHKINGIHTPLLSIGQLCDDNCIAIFNHNEVLIAKSNTVSIKINGKPLLKGLRATNKLWYVPIPTQPLPQPTHSANSAYHQPNAKKLAVFLHAAAGYPPVSTFCKAIDNGFLTTWPGLTSKLVRKHIEQSIPSIMGRMKRTRQGLRSTTRTPPQFNDTDTLEAPRDLRNRQHQVGACAFNFEALQGLICTDLPGRLPCTSSRGNNYIFILYDYDSNAILAEPIRSRSSNNLIAGYDACYNRLKEAGIHPILHRLDNETSRDLRANIKAKGLDYQLVDTYAHRRNLAERAIGTFKSHFISILNGCSNTFPAHLWCRLIPQAVLTLNLLRRSRMNPKLSAYNQIFGMFNFDRTPLAPLGTEVYAYVPKEKRTGAFAGRATHGWYVAPAMEHYRNYRIYIPATRATIPMSTVVFLPTQFHMPKTSSNDRIQIAVENLIAELQQKQQPAAPFLTQGHPTNQATALLREYFNPTTAPSARVSSQPTATPARVTRTRQPTPRIYRDPRIQLSNILPNNSTRTTRNRTSSAMSASEPGHTTSPYGFAVTHHSTGKQMEYKDLIKDPYYRDAWLTSKANELGRLAQGVSNRFKGTNTIFFIHRNQVPHGRTVTYARTVCTIRPEKEEQQS